MIVLNKYTTAFKTVKYKDIKTVIRELRVFFCSLFYLSRSLKDIFDETGSPFPSVGLTFFHGCAMINNENI